ncbi:FadR/GntR family transcriptional regulator [Simiduia agarivorans]|uniref:GntR family transcriptional regulator n=1 Tax=Simiduia agarivorans (strain DSM 21679 / JCM 13881 / BCRC 17597 / SA1) TaxID=1117647 RepID=K4KL84_SIMAS|nr:FadR/GntR family transcriptional regulator [Simiduia agarivorans]AFU98813.1 GntR family transcriptional regulator [Simiduia agarivorans SA1 = DSM 21679]
MELQAVKAERLYLKVAEQLSRLITDGTIKPGERLPSERVLADKLGVSRPTIREAMIALEISGVIEIRTGSGIYATQKQSQQPELDLGDKGVGPFEILEIRFIVESEACALAAARISGDQIAALKLAIKEMEEEEKRPDASEQADWKFHQIIAEATQNSAIESIVNWLWELRNQSELSSAFMERLRSEGVHPSIEDHRKIVMALEQKNPEKARAAMRNHIDNATAAAATYFGKAAE